MKQTIKLLLGIMIASIVLSSCGDGFFDCLEGDGNIIQEDRAVGWFDEIKSTDNFEVFITQDTISEVLIEADENLMPFIELDKNNDRLILRTQNNKCLRPSSPIRIYVKTTGLTFIKESGSGLIEADGLKTGFLETELSGSGNIILTNLDVNQLDANISGSGDIEVDGTCSKSDFKTSGSGEIDAFDLIQDECKAKITGSGNMYVNVSRLLDVKITGSGNVYYLGNPSHISKDLTGSGNVIKY